MNYDETWEAMKQPRRCIQQDYALETMLKDLKTAVDENNQEEIRDITDACVAFMLSMFNNTVKQV